jgi:hypothetical protein
MDKAFSILCFPVGLMICFTPMFIVWLKAELRDARAEKQRNINKR